MKKVFLLRHCEAYQFQDEVSDYDKSLNDVGIEDSKVLNKWFDDNNILLDCIITSSAYRTLQTAKNVFVNYKDKIIEKKNLYLCNSIEIIKELKSLNNSYQDVVLIGHEPSISESLKYLTINYRPDLRDVLTKPYPTGGIAILYFDLAKWDDIDEKTGTLDAFLSPTYLKKNEKKN